VAAHLEPEILIVDEVLAVGDAAFQKKCLGKMQDVALSGRTVFFVSHQMDSVRRLCATAIWMDEGRLVAHQGKDEVIASYLSAGPAAANAGTWINLSSARRSGNGRARFVALQLSSRRLSMSDQPFSDGPLDVTLRIESDAPRRISSLAIVFFDQFGTKLVNADTIELGASIPIRQGLNEVEVRIESLHLKSGSYLLGLWLAHAGEVFDRVDEALIIEIFSSPMIEGFGGRPPCDGVVTCKFHLLAN
jgi:lipopolysaccharide transport system ATP-binding protein